MVIIFWNFATIYYMFDSSQVKRDYENYSTRVDSKIFKRHKPYVLWKLGVLRKSQNLVETV